MPEGHRFPFNQDLWTVLEEATVGTIETVVRIRADSNPELAAADAGRILEGLRSERGSESLGLRVEVPGFTEKRGESGEAAGLAALLALVVALVLVSCSNVSNLLFARALARADRLVIHAALGAAPAQVALQMFCEALLISVGGAAVGLGLSALAIDYIESTLSGHWGYYWMAVRFEPGVVAFTLSLAVITGVISGVMPALRLWRADLGEVLKSNSAGVVGGSRRRFSAVLLNGQVAFSCFALIIAILLARGLLGSQIADGFPAEDVFVAGFSLESPAYDQPDRRRAFRESLLGALRSDDAIADVALSNVTPGLSNSVSRLEIEGVPRHPDARPEIVAALAVTASYFAILRADLASGRGFIPSDSLPGEHVAVVSETFARRHLPTADALGQRLRLEQLTGDDWLRIVGVIADVAEYAGADERSLARVYVPFAQVDPRSAYVLYTGRPAAATGTVRATIAALDPDVAVTGSFGQPAGSPVGDIMRYVRRIYLTGGVLAMLGGVGAAIVALIGLYGALTFEVQRRVAEIGVRMALGATSREVLLHTATRGLAGVAPGLFFGFLVSVGVGPLFGILLGGANPRDPVVHLGVYFAFLAVAIVAAVVPARHAARLDPVTVLRKG